LHLFTKLNDPRQLFVVILILTILSSLPTASSLPPCLIQNVSLDYPRSVMPAQPINMLTRIQASCLQWPPMSTAYVIRVDLTDTRTGYILSTSSYQVGYTQTDIDTIVTNPATAPNFQGVWTLQVDFYIFQGGDMLVHGTNFGTIQVGNPVTATQSQQTTTTVTTSMPETSSTRQTQTLYTTENANFVPSTQQLEYALVALILVLVLVALIVLPKLKRSQIKETK